MRWSATKMIQASLSFSLACSIRIPELPENSTFDDPVICYAPTMITTNGIWQGDNPLDYSLPLFLLQLMLIIVTTRLLDVVLKPLRQPRVIAEILGGVLLGPSVLGRNKDFSTTVFPTRSVMVIDTMANIGLLYFLFLVGVEMDISDVRRTQKKAIVIAIAGMILPFMMGAFLSFVLQRSVEGMSQGPFLLFLGVSLSTTAFPVLARVLAELKLLSTEMGRMAMSSALINDMLAWMLLVIAIALTDAGTPSIASLWVILSSAAFVVFYIFVVRHAISWMIQRTPEGESFSEIFLHLILTGVMISGFITDALGTHCAFGAFTFGLVIPNGPLGMTLTEKLEDFVTGLLLPLFFASSGLKTDITIIHGAGAWGFLFFVFILACAGKIAGTVLASMHWQMSVYDGITLGLLMNTKGLIEMIILNVGWDQKVLDDRSFAVMVVAAVTMTGIVTPIVSATYKPARTSLPYMRRTIQKSTFEEEFRVLVCIHTPRNVPAIINLLEASYPTRKSPICVYVLHLVELTGRASAMLIVHSTTSSSHSAPNRTQAQSDQIINAFENLEKHLDCITIQPLTAISPYSTMHEDICNLGEDKHVAFIILPFHKQRSVDGRMEATNPAFRTVNENVLANAPCSVGILVDRGLSGSTRSTASQVTHHIVILFFGGPDDREALAYAWRMSEHPGVSITLMRFVMTENATKHASQRAGDGARIMETDNTRDTHLDEEYIDEFRAKNANNESVVYTEKVVNNSEETVEAIRSIDIKHDLLVVGRGQGVISPLTAGLTEWSECPELGAIGDMLASSDFLSAVSVLVVQQYQGLHQQDGSIQTSAPYEDENDNFKSTQGQPPSPSTHHSNTYS